VTTLAALALSAGLPLGGGVNVPVPPVAPPTADLPGLSAAPDGGLDLKNGRLPETVIPKSYDLRLNTDPDEGGFAGVVTIAAEARAATDEIELHSLDLSVRSALVNGRPARVEVDAAAQTVRLKLDAPVAPGAVKIVIDYTGRINQKLVGLYASEATVDGRKEKYAFTKFEPTHARRMLPCFDEPAAKAAFKLTLTTPERLTHVSNMPAVSEKIENGLKTTEFAESPVMSTYLLAFAAGNLKPVSRDVAGTKITVWARPSEIHQAGFALDTAENALLKLNEYFDLPYALPKMDLVAVPDFQSGAMENWGAIFFRDSALLVDPKLSSSRAKRRVADVVTHEIVHQWFGNLVTMDWWNDLWLNEAFATWMASKQVDQWKPEWNTPVEDAQGKQVPLKLDSLESTRSVAADAKTPAQIDAMFDPLTYQKGANILRMLESWLGEDAFRAGIRTYIKRHQWGNTQADDLWRALEEASGKPVGDVARGWLNQPGYPILEASLNGDNTLEFSQRRFRLDGARTEGQWKVPVDVKYQIEGEAEPRTERLLLDEHTTSLRLAGRPKWALVNADGKGFFRVSLSPELAAPLREAPLSQVDKIGLLGDQWALIQSGEGAIGEFLDTLLAFAPNGERAVVEEAAAYLSALSDKIVGNADREAFAALAKKVLEPHADRLGWTGGGDEERLARSTVLWALGSIAMPADLLAEAAAKLTQYLGNPGSVDTSLVQTVLNLGAKMGDTSRFSTYLARLRAAATPEQKNQFFRALAEFSDPALTRQWLDVIKSDEVRGQDTWIPLQHLLRNPATQIETWKYLKANWPAFTAKMDTRGVRRIVEGLASVWDRDTLAEIEVFFAQPGNLPPSEQKALSQSVESIRLGLRFKDSQSSALSAKLGTPPN
jgi:puromycin-sensitive aminopeptidase